MVTPETLLPIRYASVDDESQAHVALRALLAVHPDFVDAGRYASKASAVAGLARHPVAVLFLDFDLAGSTGFELLAGLDDVPVTVLITAHANYAVEAFERGVRDYLLKPVSADRLALCLDRLRSLLVDRATPRTPKALAFFCGRGHRLVPPGDIFAIDAEGNFCSLLTAKELILVSESMKALESRLALFGFVRIHKCHMVNRRHVVAFDAHEVTLTGGIHRPIGRLYRDAEF